MLIDGGAIKKTEPTVERAPLLTVHQLVPLLRNQVHCSLHIACRNGVRQCLFCVPRTCQPGTGPGMQRGNFHRRQHLDQMLLQQPLKQWMIAIPARLSVQRKQEEIVLLQQMQVLACTHNCTILGTLASAQSQPRRARRTVDPESMF